MLELSKWGSIMINKEIFEIRDRFLEAVKPQKIILFGSYAKDSFTEDRDYDFYLIMPDDTKNVLHSAQKAYLSLIDMDTKPVDIVVNTAAVFEKRSKMPTLERLVAQDGVVIYE